MQITTQRTVMIFNDRQISVWTERDISGPATRWAINLDGWITDLWRYCPSSYEATKAGLESIMQHVDQPVISVRYEVSCEMLSTADIEQIVVAQVGDAFPIVEF